MRFPIDVIHSGEIVLRPYRLDDLGEVVAGCADPLTRRFLTLLPSPYTSEDARWWIAQGAPDAFANGGAAYAIADPTTGRLLGGIGVNHVNPGLATGVIGYWVASQARGRGVATAATRALARLAFESGLARLALHTAWENGPSQRVAIAAGFRREGVERGGGIDRGGNRVDKIVWARLATDSGEPTPRLLPDLPGGELSDGIITVRRLSLDDLPDTYALHQLADVVHTSVPPVAPSLADVRQRCARAEANWLAGDRADLTIRDAATGSYAGDVGLYYQEPGTGQAMIGYSMHPAWRGRGYATRAARLVASWAFTHAGIARVIAGTAPENIGSQKVLMAAGFAREGYSHSRLPGVNGTRIDDILFARLP